jgi:hypothetical protein
MKQIIVDAIKLYLHDGGYKLGITPNMTNPSVQQELTEYIHKAIQMYLGKDKR